MSSWALLPFVLYFLAESGSGGSASLFQKESKASGPLTISIVNNYNFLSGNDAKRVAAIADKPVASLNDVPGNSQNPSSANPDKSIGHVDGACPLGWSYFEGTRKCFKVFEQRKSWNESRANCKQHGAKLASITSEEENAFVVGIALPLVYDSSNTISSNDGFWLGLRRNVSESQCCHFGTCPDERCFVGDWEDGRRVRIHVMETSWANMWPEDEHPKQYEDCIQILVANPNRYGSTAEIQSANKWLGYSCRQAVRGHICERSFE
ncbi:macrophage mannose receptor 1-like [Aphelenchoides avenae]|nr:macrophage mannose receptor 1-like [Aphelenchus avenae]